MSKGAPLSLSPASRELLEQVVREGSLDGLLAALGSSHAESDETGLPDGVASMEKNWARP